MAFLMARSITSLGTELVLASFTANRSRGFFSGSGSPILAATVISFASFEKSFERAASCRPLRCWMFAHFEWPAMVTSEILVTICIPICHPAPSLQPGCGLVRWGLVRMPAAEVIVTHDQVMLFTLFAVIFALFIWGRVRFDLVAFAALLTGVILGLVPAEDAFSGFGHHATVIVALVLLVSGGLVDSGAIQLITRTLIKKSYAMRTHISIMSGLGAALSGFINNVAALALLMPVDVETARKAGRAPGLTLMPLSFATILGGLVPLLGTPPNIIVASIREEELGESFAMFDFAPVGAVAAIAGMAFITLIGWRLIPDRAASSDPVDALQEASAYLAELSVPEDNDLIDHTLDELYDEMGVKGANIIGLIRDGKRRFGSNRRTKIRAGDIFLLEATAEALEEFRSNKDLEYTDAERRDATKENSHGLELLELVVPRDARIAGRTARAIGLNWRHRTVVVGVSRQGRQIRNHLQNARIQPGDI